VLSHVPSALDRSDATRLRARGIPVLEGTLSGLLALRHLLELRDYAERPTVERAAPDPGRATRWSRRLAAGPLDPIEAVALLSDYGIRSPSTHRVTTRAQAMSAAEAVGYPAVLKTAAAGQLHKSDVGGVVLGLDSAEAVGAAFDEMASRLGPRALVAETAPAGVELALGMVRDPLLGPLVVLGAGGTMVELLADRVVALPPLDVPAAHRMLDRLTVRPLLGGFRGQPASDVDAVASAVVSVATMAIELGDAIAALDVNPLSCSPTGALALDVLVEVDAPAST
jgi:acetate---CoA ligase (ADP-forming)